MSRVMGRQPTRLEVLRAKAGMTQEQLAEAAGVSTNVITAIEGRWPNRRIRTTSYAKLAAALGAELEELLEEAV